jgi:hypothetical protein
LFEVASMIADLLAKLERVRKTGQDSWSARCPAHDDRGPSLSIRDVDGKILLHCFCGCSASEVVSAIGLEISDLFPPRDHHGKPVRNPFPVTDALRAIAFEALVVVASAKALADYPDADRDRLVEAAARINNALSATGISRGEPWART